MFYRLPRDVNNHQKQQKSLDVEVVCEFHKRSKRIPYIFMIYLSSPNTHKIQR